MLCLHLKTRTNRISIHGEVTGFNINGDNLANIFVGLYQSTHSSFVELFPKAHNLVARKTRVWHSKHPFT